MSGATLFVVSGNFQAAVLFIRWSTSRGEKEEAVISLNCKSSVMNSFLSVTENSDVFKKDQKEKGFEEIQLISVSEQDPGWDLNSQWVYLVQQRGEALLTVPER